MIGLIWLSRINKMNKTLVVLNFVQIGKYQYNFVSERMKWTLYLRFQSFYRFRLFYDQHYIINNNNINPCSPTREQNIKEHSLHAFSTAPCSVEVYLVLILYVPVVVLLQQIFLNIIFCDLSWWDLLIRVDQN